MTTMKKHLREFEIGETFTGFFVLRKKELRTKYDGEPYAVLEFGDRSGRLSGNIWNEAVRIYHELEVGMVVKVQGRIEQYRDSTQVAINQLRRATPDDLVDPADLLPSTDADPEEQANHIRNTIRRVRNEYFHRLLNEFFDDPDFTRDFLRAPGGKLWHHNRLGGLAEHTLSVCRMSRVIGKFYPEVDTDLLLTGALLHDIGKIEEYRYDTVIDYTDRGRLVGHIAIGLQWINQRAASIDGFPPKLLDKLQHIVLSHQGDEFSLVKPATREAFLFHYIDQIDSKMDALNRIAAQLPDGEYSTYVRLLERFVNLSSPDDDVS